MSVPGEASLAGNSLYFGTDSHPAGVHSQGYVARSPLAIAKERGDGGKERGDRGKDHSAGGKEHFVKVRDRRAKVKDHSGGGKDHCMVPNGRPVRGNEHSWGGEERPAQGKERRWGESRNWRPIPESPRNFRTLYYFQLLGRARLQGNRMKLFSNCH